MENEVKKEMIVNELPARTWNRLGVNETRILWEEDKAKQEEQKFRIPEGEQADTLVIRSGDEKGPFTGNRFLIEAEAGSSVTVVEYVDVHSPLMTEVTIQVGARAKVRFVQLCVSSAEAVLYHNLKVRCEEEGRFEVISALLGKGQIHTDSYIDLIGDRSMLTADTGYYAKDGQQVDINFAVNHYGRESISTIDARGTVANGGKKIFKGTIDFKKGSAGSVGSENETVLLIGEDVENKTVPLILCAEENVEGTHGASIGGLSPEMLYYFASRGIDQAAAEEIMAGGAIERLGRLSREEDFIQNLQKVWEASEEEQA